MRFQREEYDYIRNLDLWSSERNSRLEAHLARTVDVPFLHSGDDDARLTWQPRPSD